MTQDELDQTIEGFKQQFGDKPSEKQPARSELIILVAHNDDPTDQMFVFFPDDIKIGIKTIRTYCKRMQEENITRAIIVVQLGTVHRLRSHLFSIKLNLTLYIFFLQKLGFFDETKEFIVFQHYVMYFEEIFMSWFEIYSTYKEENNC